MLYTSNEANKLLKTYQDKISDLLTRFEQSDTFIVATIENVDDVRPEYNFLDEENQLIKLQEDVRKIKHAINKFNTTTVIPEFNMTIDEMLVALPQWNGRLIKYNQMKNRLPKMRLSFSTAKSGLVEYKYINYDLEDVINMYNELSEKVNIAQLALNTINSTVKGIEID